MTTAFGPSYLGRVAIVTGGSRGVGRATAQRLVNGGYAVVVNYAHDQEAADAAVEELLSRNGVAMAVRANVGDDLDVERLFAETIETFGGVDAVVNAAHSSPDPAPLSEMSLERYEEIWRTTGHGALLVSREAARHIRDGGAIVNIASSAAMDALPAFAICDLICSAIRSLTRTFALQLMGRNVTANALLFDVAKPCEPSMVADVISYLLSGEGHPITGQVIDVETRSREELGARNGAG
jgi:3-oxoacyl-[acyl-carrier protein] reductase